MRTYAPSSAGKKSGCGSEKERAKSHRDHPLRELQHTIGNQASTRALMGRFKSHSLLNGALAVHQPNDHHESPSGFRAPLDGMQLMRPAPPVVQSSLRPDPRAELLTQAGSEPASPLDESVRRSMEAKVGADLGAVRVHAGPASAAAAESIGARAYTIGSDIHLGVGALQSGSGERNRVLTHEAIHTVQQGGRPVSLSGTLPMSQPGDPSEVEARRIADSAGSSHATASAALGMRDSLRVVHAAPSIQRDIKGNKEWKGVGKFTVDFTKNDGTVAGDKAFEDGTVKFMPDATAPESDSIKFIQIVRDFDVSTGKEFDWTTVPGEGNRMKMETTGNAKKNIAPGFFIDQNAASLTPRTKKADPAVLPFYDVSGPPIAGNKIGKRRGATREEAVLADTPGSAGLRKFNFVSVVKASDTGIVYGTVLWGFETFHDKAGVTKIKNEYKSFRIVQGETFDAALRLFNEFYKNPGTPGAPAK